MLVIGNDIVDLTAPENRGKSGDRRFRARVFTAAEEGWIDAAAVPDAVLWMLWTAKEAAFKAAVKLKPGLTFRPREYAVTKLAAGAFTGSIIDGPERQGFRSFAEDLAPLWPVVAGGTTESVLACGAIITPVGLLDVFFAVSPFRVHCLAQGRNGNGSGQREKHFHCHEEKRTGSFDPSGAVRRAAVHYLADALHTSPYFLAIHRPRTPLGEIGPPRVFLEGRQTDIDISFSHDGIYLAFAVRLERDAGK